MIVTVKKIAGSVDTDTFTDITAVPVSSVAWNADGGLDIDFAGDLTADEQVLVKIRCVSDDAAEEDLFRQAYTAYKANQSYLGIASPTTAQAVAQVAALTRQTNSVIRVLVGI